MRKTVSVGEKKHIDITKHILPSINMMILSAIAKMNSILFAAKQFKKKILIEMAYIVFDT